HPIAVRPHVAADCLIGIIDTKHRNWEPGVCHNEKRGVPAAHNPVSRPAQTFAEAAVLAYRYVPAPADIEIVLGIKECSSALGPSVLRILPIRALAIDEVRAASIKAAIVCKSLAKCVRGHELETGGHALPACHLKRMIIHVGRRVCNCNGGDQWLDGIERPP